MPPEELHAYRRYLEQLHYEDSIAETIKFDEEFAKRKAREEGREEGKLDTAVKLIKKGVDIDIIASATGFPRERIEDLAREIH